MIICRTPLRISFVGGGTDLASFYQQSPGAVVSTAINKYIYITVNKKFDEKIRVSYSKTEFADQPEDLKHELIRESLLLLGIRKGIEITSISDIPSEGTGLGSSSTYTVGLLNALHAYKNEFASAERLAQEACSIEIDKCGKVIGKQNQYVAAYGNFNFTQFFPDRVSVEPIIIKNKKEFEAHFLLFYTGITRSAKAILEEQDQKTKKNFGKMKAMAVLAKEAKKAIEKGSFDDFGEILHQNWVLKKGLVETISNPVIDQWYLTARGHGAIGGKILGAGGGGFLLLYAPPNLHELIKSALPELRHIPFSFEPEGSKIIYYGER